MIANDSPSHGDGRKSAQLLSEWLAREMASAADRSTSEEVSSESAVRAIRECVDLLSQFWLAGTAEAGVTNGVQEPRSIETPSLLDQNTPNYSESGLELDTVGDDKSPESIGRIGRFEVRQFLGSGGFGIVLLVFDPQLNREAALKLPRPEILVSPQLRQRFLREAQAAAVLDHPNIIPVYETGEIGPVGYILSAYCGGPTLATWLQAQQGSLAPQLAAEIVETLACAVQHAHSRGILHRDIKPSNVLLELGREPRLGGMPFVPRLGDFGLAKRLDQASEQTRAGMVIGTPRYMAPEQACGDERNVGVQTDVYSLGVILYELLAGNPPFIGQTDAETLRKVQTQQPAVAELRARKVPRDLESVCMKCLDKDHHARYPSAVKLADDLRHFLQGEAVSARPLRTTERLMRWCRRNRAVAALAAGVLLSLIAGTSLSTYYALSASVRAREAEAERGRAVQALNQARRAVDESFTVLSEQTLLNEPGMQPLRKRLLQSALKYYEDFVREHSDSLYLRAELARAHGRAGAIGAMIGEHNEAEAHFLKAIDIWESLARDDLTSTDQQHDLAAGYMQLANWQNVARRSAQTIELFRKAIAIRQNLVLQYPTNATYQSELAASLHGLATSTTVTDGRMKADAMLRSAMELREQLVRAYPDNLGYLNDLAISYHALADAHKEDGRHAEAEGFFGKAIDIRERIARDDPTTYVNKRELAQSYVKLAKLRTRMRRLATAEPLFRQALEIRTDLAEANPTVVSYQRDLADGYDSLAEWQIAAGQLADAEASYRQAITIQQQLTARDPSVAGYQFQLGHYCWGLTVLLSSIGRIAEAKTWCQKANEAREATVRDEPNTLTYRGILAHSYLRSGDIHSGIGQHDDALAYYPRAIELYEQLLRDRKGDVELVANLVGAVNGQALSLVKSHQIRAAQRHFRNAIGGLQSASDAGDDQESQRKLARLHASLGVQNAMLDSDWKLIEDELLEAQSLAPDDLIVRILCGDAAAFARKWREAADAYGRADELCNHDWWTLQRYARLLWAAGDLEGYRAACSQLIERFGSTTALSNQGCVITLTCLLDDQLVRDMAPVIELATRMRELLPDDAARAAALGGALLRSGRLDEAVEVLMTARPPHFKSTLLAADRRDEERLGNFYVARFLAAAYREMGRTDDYCSMVAEINEKLQEMERAIAPTAATMPPWSYRLAAEIARRDFETTLEPVVTD